jgi:hypothetical protein
VVIAAARALHLLHSLHALGFGFGGDQIGQAFGFQQIHLAVHEGAAGEFARLGHAQARQPGQQRQHIADDGKAAMQMQLGDVLAGEAVRGRKIQGEAAIDDVARRVAQRRVMRMARGEGGQAGELLDGGGRLRAGKAQHGDAGASGGGGEGEDGVGAGHGRLGVLC